MTITINIFFLLGIIIGLIVATVSKWQISFKNCANNETFKHNLIFALGIAVVAVTTTLAFVL